MLLGGETLLGGIFLRKRRIPMPENAPTTPTAPTLNEQEKKSDRIYRFIISALCFAMCTVQIVNVIYPSLSAPSSL